MMLDAPLRAHDLGGRIKRWSECDSCKICEKTCEWGAIRGPEIVMSECVRCDDCERLYLNTAKQRSGHGRASAYHREDVQSCQSAW